MKFAEKMLFPGVSGKMALTEEETNILLEVLSVALDNLPIKCNKGNVLIYSQEYARERYGFAELWDFDYPVLDATLEDGNFRQMFPNTADYKSEILTSKAVGAVVDWSAYARLRTSLGLGIKEAHPTTCIVIGHAYNALILNSDEGRFIASSQVVETEGKDGCCTDKCKWSYQNQVIVLLAIAQTLTGLRPNDQRLQEGLRVLLDGRRREYPLFFKIDSALKTCLKSLNK